MARRKMVRRLPLTEVKTSRHTNHREFLLGFYNTDLNVTVAHKAEPIRRWICNVQHHSRRFIQSRRLIVGLSFGGELNDSVSSIHLLVARKILIIQLLRDRKAPPREILKDFFSNKRINFVGINNPRHASILSNLGICSRKIHDLKDWLFEENEKPSYKDVIDEAELNLEFELQPQISNINWSKTTLSNLQINQAATDAFVSLRIGVKILGKYMIRSQILTTTFRSTIYKIEDKQVIVEKLGEPQQSYDDFAATLPDNEFRYTIYDFDFITEENCQKNMIFFIAWYPDTAKGKLDEMIYESFEDTFKRELDGIQVELQAPDPTEMDLDVFKSHTN